MALVNKLSAALSQTSADADDKYCTALKHAEKTLELFPQYAPAVEMARELCKSLAELAGTHTSPSRLEYSLKSLVYAKQALELPGADTPENFIFVGNGEVNIALADQPNALSHLNVRAPSPYPVCDQLAGLAGFFFVFHFLNLMSCVCVWLVVGGGGAGSGKVL